VIDKLTAVSVNHRVTNILPFPEGEYMLKLNWIVYGSSRLVVKLYLAIT